MWDMAILLFALVEPHPVCTRAPKRPPLLEVDAKGKCPANYQPMPEKTKQAQYCIATSQPEPVCKAQPLPPQGKKP